MAAGFGGLAKEGRGIDSDFARFTIFFGKEIADLHPLGIFRPPVVDRAESGLLQPH